MIPEAYAETHAAAMQNSRPWNTDEFERLMAADTTLLCGDPMSFVLGRVLLDEAEILTVATHPAYQRQGKAKSILSSFIDEISERAVTLVHLEVAADNAPARALYDQAGFAQSGVRQGYYQRTNGPACDAIVMQLTLPQR